MCQKEFKPIVYKFIITSSHSKSKFDSDRTAEMHICPESIQAITKSAWQGQVGRVAFLNPPMTNPTRIWYQEKINSSDVWSGSGRDVCQSGWTLDVVNDSRLKPVIPSWTASFPRFYSYPTLKSTCILPISPKPQPTTSFISHWPFLKTIR